MQTGSRSLQKSYRIFGGNIVGEPVRMWGANCGIKVIQTCSGRFQQRDGAVWTGSGEGMTMAILRLRGREHRDTKHSYLTKFLPYFRHVEDFFFDTQRCLINKEYHKTKLMRLKVELRHQPGSLDYKWELRKYSTYFSLSLWRRLVLTPNFELFC